MPKCVYNVQMVTNGLAIYMEQKSKITIGTIAIALVAIISFGKMGYKAWQSHQEEVQAENGSDLHAYMLQLMRERYNRIDLFIAEMNTELPVDDMDGNFVYTDFSRKDNEMIIRITAKPDTGQDMIDQDIKNAPRDNCADDQYAFLLYDDFSVRTIYTNSAGKEVGNVVVNKLDCPAPETEVEQKN